MEALYDHLAPKYWNSFGLYSNFTHRQFIEKFFLRLTPLSSIMDAVCGAGRYDGFLLEAGHTVLGIDQSAGMLEKAPQHYPPESYPQLSYERVSLQEMAFNPQFDGAICVDSLEHVFPEDWPGIVRRMHNALKPGGRFYFFTSEVAEPDEISQSYERARAPGLPVVFGELADKIDASYSQLMALDWQDISGELAGTAAYHFYPSLEQVRLWLNLAGFVIE